MPATASVCREILELNPDHLSSLHFLADLEMRSANFAVSEIYFRKLLGLKPADAQLHSNLGQVLYRQGKHEAAARAYQDYWQINPRNAMVYLALGCLYVEMGDVENAAQVFSLGESIDRKLISHWKDPACDPQLAQMSRTGWNTLCQHHTAMHYASVDSVGDDVQRIRNGVWPLLDEREVKYRHEKQRAQVFYFDLPQIPPFYEREGLPWVAALEAQFEALREEILSGLDLEADGRPYLGDGHQLEGEEWEPVVNKMAWASVHLFSAGVANNSVITKFEKTLEALKNVPLATYRGKPAEVFISVLAPKTTIPPHYGVSSANLTVHLPIVVPGDCGLKAGGEVRVPEEGRILAFDDTWEHSAWNHTDQQRVVLIFEVWNPQLAEPEKQAILDSFYAREDWLKSRSVIPPRG